jgi:hypothetical protein
MQKAIDTEQKKIKEEKEKKKKAQEKHYNMNKQKEDNNKNPYIDFLNVKVKQKMKPKDYKAKGYLRYWITDKSKYEWGKKINGKIYTYDELEGKQKYNEIEEDIKKIEEIQKENNI